MSGYDALDELYERLRGQEDARRAGGITPETIRAARGGVAGENGRIPATAAESAARADSVPLVDISRDSRERIEADAWEAARLDMSRTWEERRDAIVALLDRQAALTERETSHDNPYVGLVRGKQWERTEMSDYYCGRCGWKVTDHDSYCPECGGALHGAPNEPDSRFDAPKTEETAENGAAKGDIRDFDDSREKIADDLEKLIKEWDDYDGDYIRIFGGVAYAQVKELLDRQAALTEREVRETRCFACNWADERAALRHQVDELRAKLDEYDQTHMLLPVDADGVPIRVGDKMKYADGTEFEVDGIGSGGTLFSVDDASNSAWWTNAEAKRHVIPRTVEDVLREFASRVLNSGHQWGLDAHDVVAEYAAELRELTGVCDE